MNLSRQNSNSGDGMKKLHPSKPSLKTKKRVSFSDHVELVSHAEDVEEEEHLPNPLLERVLGKAFLQSNHIKNS